MLARLEAQVRRLVRLLDPSEWMVALLGLPRDPGSGIEPGLLVIQIDGLGKTHLERALGEGRMPFTARLLQRDGYRLHSLYSGCPASTPAFQGELFYGVRTAVPGFGFRDHDTGALEKMYLPATAARVEVRLADGREGLLAGGSAYGDVFTGGAAEPHLCAASFGFGSLLTALSPLRLLALVLVHGLVALRTAGMVVVELLVGLWDALHGVREGHDAGAELRFVLARALLCVAMREFTVRSARMDLARGLPVVHVNLIGFDEQAHRRGPGSRFAQWSLGAIDHAVARLAKSAWRSARRDYEVWIHSDHGQDDARPYPLVAGRTLAEAVEEALSQAPRAPGSGVHRGSETGRVLWSGVGWMARLLGQDEDQAETGPGFTLAALGPLGHVHPEPSLAPGAREQVAARLVEEFAIPQVLWRDGEDRIRVRSRAGVFDLEADPLPVLGADHPFGTAVPGDLAALVRHPDAGELVLSGWAPGVAPVTFAAEHGSHAGFSPEETLAFAMLPPGCLLHRDPGRVLRAGDLREEALAHLSRLAPSRPPPPRTGERRPETLRIVTYNAHGCRGSDGRVSSDRIARVLSSLDPDVIALQELDVGRSRSNGLHQAREIADRLAMFHHFHASFRIEEEEYGNAVISRFPMRLVRAGALPRRRPGARSEPRGAVWVELDVDGARVQLLNTHFGLHPEECRVQAEALLGPEWLGDPQAEAPLVLAGDFNAMKPGMLAGRPPRRLRDVQVGLSGHRPLPTWTAALPVRRIDHVFVSPEVEVVAVEVPRNRLTRLASDHLPLLVELRLARR